MSVQLAYRNKLWFDENSEFILREGQQVHLGQTGTYKIGDGKTPLRNLQFLPKLSPPITNITNDYTVNNTIINGGGEVRTVVATENIAKGNVVDANGTVVNSSQFTKRSRIIGIAKDDILNGFVGEVVVMGEIQRNDWSFTVGDNIFLNGINLSIATPVTGFIQRIGTAKNNNTIYIDLNPSILI